ncbi:hypothetical protein AGMMS49957_01910 [Synergistales bacterium]|nr:hypothetical protein AGMMS49957_01910 [Synergistales bacterium]
MNQPLNQVYVLTGEAAELYVWFQIAVSIVTLPFVVFFLYKLFKNIFKNL